MRKIVSIVGCALLCVLLAGTIDDTIVKPLVQRWRPTHDPEIGVLVDIVDGSRGGNYGFFSAHASNTFTVAVFLSLLFRHRLAGCLLISWAALNGYTRIYLGVHYFGDVLVGILVGIVIGFGLYKFMMYKMPQYLPHAVSEGLTPSGFSCRKMYMLSTCILLNYILLFIIPFV